MIIALDYDGTYTKDPNMWNEFIRLALCFGHVVYCVTSREEEHGGQEVKDTLECHVSGIFFTNGELKEPYMFKQGIVVDVWIDDAPGTISRTGKEEL